LEKRIQDLEAEVAELKLEIAGRESKRSRKAAERSARAFYGTFEDGSDADDALSGAGAGAKASISIKSGKATITKSDKTEVILKKGVCITYESKNTSGESISHKRKVLSIDTQQVKLQKYKKNGTWTDNDNLTLTDSDILNSIEIIECSDIINKAGAAAASTGGRRRKTAHRRRHRTRRSSHSSKKTTKHRRSKGKHTRHN
jgi:hypothetical protein